MEPKWELRKAKDIFQKSVWIDRYPELCPKHLPSLKFYELKSIISYGTTKEIVLYVIFQELTSRWESLVVMVKT